MDAVPVAEVYRRLLHDYSISTVRSVNIKPPVKPSELISHVLLMQPPPGCCMDCSSMNPFPLIFFFFGSVLWGSLILWSSCFWANLVTTSFSWLKAKRFGFTQTQTWCKAYCLEKVWVLMEVDPCRADRVVLINARIVQRIPSAQREENNSFPRANCQQLGFRWSCAVVSGVGEGWFYFCSWCSGYVPGDQCSSMGLCLTYFWNITEKNSFV